LYATDQLKLDFISEERNAPCAGLLLGLMCTEELLKIDIDLSSDTPA